MSKRKLSDKELIQERLKAKPGKPTRGESRNTPESVSLWFDLMVGVLQDNASLLYGAATNRPEVREYHEHVAAIKLAVKNGEWRTAILSAWLAGQAQATAGLADEALRERRSQMKRDAWNDSQTPRIEKMRRQLAEWDKKLKGKPKKDRAMRQLGIPKSTYYKYKNAVKETDKQT